METPIQRLPVCVSLAGRDAAQHLREAGRLFSEMGLPWDLACLGAVQPAPVLHEPLLA